MKTDQTKKKAGRPSIPKEKKAVKPDVTISRHLYAEFRSTADRIEMGYSEFLSTALIREIARVEGVLSKPLESLPDQSASLLKRA